MTMVLGLTEAAASQPPNPWIAPMGVLVGALIGGLLAGFYRLAGDKAARRTEGQRAALHELQLSALALRSALGRYGQKSSPTSKDDEKLDRFFGEFELRIQRVLCEQVRDRAEAWPKVAVPYYTGDRTVTFKQENDRWTELQRFIGEELRRLDR